MHNSIIKIAIADDYQLFREGLKRLLSDEANMDVIWLAQNGLETLSQIKKQAPDVLLLDVQMPDLNGIEVLTEIASNYPNLKVIILSMFHDRPYIEKAFKLGAHGYLLKNAANDELLHAIKLVCDGGKYFSAEITSALLQPEQNIINLTKREREVLTLIAQEYSNVDIAEKLFLSVETINSHRKNLLRKLDVKNTVGLVKYAIQQGLI